MDATWLGKSHIRACVDRITFRFEPVIATTREEVTKHIPRGWQGQLREIGESGRLFRVTIQEPACIPAVVAVLDRMNHRLPLTREPTLELLEVAIDVCPTIPGSIDLERVAADLLKGAKYEPSDNTRAAATKGRTTGLHSSEAIYRALKEGKTLYNGNSDDARMVRCYVKRTDNKVALDPKEHRARFELQLQEDGLPVTTVRALGAFRFESLAGKFLMRTVADGLSPLAALLAERVPKFRRYPRHARHARVFGNKAFLPFNRLAYSALARLTSLVQGASRSPYGPHHMAIFRSRSVTTDRFSTSFVAVSDQPDRENTPVALTTFYKFQTLQALPHAGRPSDGPRVVLRE